MSIKHTMQVRTFVSFKKYNGDGTVTVCKRNSAIVVIQKGQSIPDRGFFIKFVIEASTNIMRNNLTITSDITDIHPKSEPLITNQSLSGKVNRANDNYLPQ